ncbi:MAG: phosphoribosylamine--glycine ligase [Planctomycetota bacterium]|nr:MAG: phosphoribosylamine--glycine ligase [Planctomycetota bacterium]
MSAASRRVLVVGSGGREHALAWKLARDGAEVISAPGNAGTAQVGENVPIQACDIPGLVALARDRDIDLTVVGPEAPLVAGIVDAFQASGRRIFGPTARAAQIEGSKLFCKQILHRGDVPTAMFREFRTPQRARDFLEAREDVPVVVKADGLAAGKGVFVCPDRAAALEAIATLSEDPQFAAAARGILVEERLDGREVSVMAITDGRTIVTLPALQDHKAAYDGDQGPNTGGMGAYCPTPFVDAELMADIEARILVPTVHSMRRAKVPFQGVLFAGLMLTPQGPKVLEFNARFGDPECEALMVLLDSSLLEILDASVDRRLESIQPPSWKSGASVTVVMASEEYPGSVAKGRPIRGLDAAAAIDGVEVFHSATRFADGPSPRSVVNDGGRTLAVTAVGETLARAKLRAYSAVREIRWSGAWCRKDIADKGIDHVRMLAASDADPAAGPTGARL